MATIVSVSLPTELRSSLDAEAERQRRPRSFVIAEAVRQYLARQEGRAFDEARERTLRDALALSPAARAQLAEDLWRELARGHKPAGPWSAAFDTFDEYERWRREGGERVA
jgi:predicted transcriptional regulator